MNGSLQILTVVNKPLWSNESRPQASYQFPGQVCDAEQVENGSTLHFKLLQV